MSLEVDQLSPKLWTQLSERAHLVVFGTFKPAEWDRIDFALVTQEDGQLRTFITCREQDSKTLYWQYGGAFPGTRETSVSFQAYQLCIAWVKERYERITTLIENDNKTMLKMAAKVGFKIVGVRNYQGKVLLEHHLEFAE